METLLYILAGIFAIINLLVVLLGLFVLIFIQRDIRDSLVYTQMLVARYTSLEQAIVAIYTMIMGPPQNPATPQTFETPDGEHKASTFEELLGKITNDPKYKGRTKPEDVDHLKSMFEEATNNDGEEEDDDDDEEEEWKNKEEK